MKNQLLLLGLMMSSTVSVWSQTSQAVRGVVTEQGTGEPIIGAAITVKTNKNKGVTTNLNGEFALNIQEPTTLIVSSIGYVSQEVTAKPGQKLQITLASDSKQLETVMVVAYGTAKKSSFTGSAVAIDQKKLERSQSSSVAKTLEGMVPGLQVSTSSGAPGSGTTLRVRGIGSLNASSAPLIVLDGAPYSGSLGSINPQDIESLSVLKDAASAALYGARGANGVILITTKTGRKGRLQISFDARVGINQRGVPEYDIVRDPAQYYELFWESIRNSKLYDANNPLSAQAAAQYASDNLYKELGYNIYKDVANNAIVGADGKVPSGAQVKYEDANSFNDWEGILYKPQIRQEYNLSLSKGTDKSKVYFSLGYLEDKGFNINSHFDRISSRLSFDNQFTDWLKLSAGSQLSLTSHNFTSSGGAVMNTFAWTRQVAPIYPVYQHRLDGSIIRDANGNAIYDDGAIYYETDASGKSVEVHGARGMGSGTNLIEAQRRNKDEGKNIYITQNVRADVDLPWDLKFNTTATYYSNQSSTTEYANPQIGDGKAYNGSLSKGRTLAQSLNWNQILNWNRNIGDFSISAMLGHENYMWESSGISGTKRNLLDPENQEFSTAAALTSLGSSTTYYRLEGFFGQMTADYKDKYYFSASLRRDGSSIFAPEHRWGTFWSLGASWRLKQEAFLKDVRWIDNLKLRLSYGVQGNDYLLLPNGYRSYRPYENLYSVGTDGENAELSPLYKGTRNITWEKNHNLDLGVEFGFFNGLISGEVDLFMRTTKDMLFNLQEPSTSGFSTRPENVGSMRNTGVEFSLVVRPIRSKDLSLELGLNGSHYRNKILSLPEENREGGIRYGWRIIKEGGGIYDFYMVRYAGVNPENGDSQFYMFNETSKQFEVVPSDKHSSDVKHRQFVGSAIADLLGGFYSNLTFKDFDLSAQFSYGIGGKAIDYGYQSLMGLGANSSNWHKDMLTERWTPENTQTNVPRLHKDSQRILSSSDRFLVDASYLSLRSLSLGYKLPESVTKRLKIGSARIYVAADNVFLISARKGFDPRVSISGEKTTADNSAIRTISLGLNLSL